MPFSFFSKKSMLLTFQSRIQSTSSRRSYWHCDVESHGCCQDRFVHGSCECPLVSACLREQLYAGNGLKMIPSYTTSVINAIPVNLPLSSPVP